MPFYPFRCQACGHEFTVKLHVAERDVEIDCPECGAISERLFVSPVIAFAQSVNTVPDFCSDGS